MTLQEHGEGPGDPLRSLPARPIVGRSRLSTAQTPERKTLHRLEREDNGVSLLPAESRNVKHCPSAMPPAEGLLCPSPHITHRSPAAEAGCRASPPSCRSGLSLLLPSLPSLPRLPWSRPALTVALWALRVPQRLQPARPPHQHQGRDQPQSKPHVRARPPPALRARSFASARGSPALRPPCRARRPPGPAPGSAAAARGALWGGRGRHLGRGAVRRGGALMEAVWKGSQ